MNVCVNTEESDVERSFSDGHMRCINWREMKGHATSIGPRNFFFEKVFWIQMLCEDSDFCR